MAVKRGRPIADNLSGTNLADQLFGLGGNDILFGLAGDDLLDGGAGADRLFGQDGNDRLLGGAGADVLNGGTGRDTADYSGAATGVNVFLYAGRGGSGEAAGDTYVSIENVTGSKFQDFIFGDTATNVLNGGAGNDYLFANGGADVLIGGGGDDILAAYGATAQSLTDIVRVMPGLGADRARGSGNDWIDYSDLSVAVTVDLSGGTNAGGAAGDQLIAFNRLTGTRFSDTLTDNASGPAGGFVQGLGGNDTIVVRGAFVTASGGDGNDQIRSTGAVATLIGGAGDDILQSSAPIFASIGATLIGGAGLDSLASTIGSRDNFRLQYDQGMDSLSGFNSLEGDRLQIIGSEFGIGATLDAAEFTVNFLPQATAAGPQFIFSTFENIIWFDRDGTGNAFQPVAIADMTLSGSGYRVLLSEFVVI